MKTAIGKIQELLYEGLPILTRYADALTIKDITDFVQKRSSDATPTVMVFGIYNAGKSTLLNAMLGEERADMGDTPMTDKVDPYPWRGFTLLDTPGIDAPIEHEEVSRAQLERSDVVLFVLSNDGSFEEFKIYEEMCNILSSKKPLIVIVNNKSGQTETDDSYRYIYDAVARNLQEEAEKRGLSQVASEVPILLINAKTALKGRLENKERLIEHSQLPVLMNTIEERLKQCGANEVAMTLLGRVNTLVEIALKDLDQKEKSSESKLFAGLQEAVQGEKARTVTTISVAIRRIMTDFRNSYRVAAETGDESRAHAVFDHAISGITREMERALEIANENLVALGHRLEAAALAVNADAIALPLQSDDVSIKNQNDSNLSFSVEDVIRNLTFKITQEGAQEATKTAVQATLTLTKTWLPSVMKGIGVKGIEKMSESAGQVVGKTIPWIGPAISIISGIRDYYKAQEAEQAQIRQMEKQARALRDAVEQQASKLERDFEDSCQLAIKKAFLPIESAIAEKSRTLGSQEQILNEDRAVLESIKLRLSLI
ncbi:50S ribosome-binding GTPase [Allochromatium humboldtianum]|uniref:50S ribosome-binding GTPase n=1 Tax=Allochromatium humboldtianum TaxID=504901 RepID=A0A850RPK7_9GAMM|nr:GTPase [Allochromatium humboldtianum]NVZ11411.1 50S ribosome-binding GTPase [Allochromatium humboldtianum]